MEINVEEKQLSVVLKEAKFDVVISAEAPLHVNVGESAKIDVGQAIDYIKSGEAEIEAAVTAGTNAFNANATAKTNAFNQNATDKTTAYNNNASAKTQDYNDNATAKLNAYNQNATDKTNAFNSNATDKITDFNDNASDKTLEFNENAAEKQAEVDASAALAKQYAIGDPSEPTGNSAKYWAEQASSSLSGLTSRVTTIEGKIPADASSSNQLADKSWVGSQGYITGITSGDVTTALGYTPYDASNPNGYQTASDVQTAIAGKQDTLVSGTNIKTINNNSIIGSGDLTIDGLPSQTGQNGKFLTTDGTEASWADVGAGLEVGDMGFAPLGVDETQNKRRYLNGQVISQAQFVEFTAFLKSRVSVYPSLSTTEVNWQAAVTNSALGQCGKFVIDDVLGTIRLPKVVNINGLQDLTGLGEIKAESLPNITGEFGGGEATLGTGAFYLNGSISGDTLSGGSSDNKMAFDASRVSSTYQNNAPVQQEAIQYPYFIQVATGVEESIDVTREIELNNPFSLLDYKWSEYEITNASWLISNGTFHSGATYVSVYELLLKIHNGTVTKDGVSVKLSTEAYEDTDFVLNTADTTFRLPIKVKLASGNAVVGNGMSLGLTDGTSYYGLQNRGANHVCISNDTYGNTVTNVSEGAANTGNSNLGVTTDPLKSGIETSSSGLKLYFYVGETIQDANVINASGVLTRVAELSDEYIMGLGMPDYSAQIALSAGTTEQIYTVPSKGYIGYNIQMGGNNTGYVKVNDVQVVSNRPAGNNYYNFVSGLIPVDKNDVIKYYSNAQPGHFNNFQFYPLKGVN